MNHDWLKEKLASLVSVADQAKEIHPNVYYLTGDWSAIKLLVVLSYLPIYTRIIPEHFDSMYYVELLAGAGICKIKETEDVVAGSALLAATLWDKPFDEYILVECDERRANALEERMKMVVANVKVFKGHDCNECIDKVLDCFHGRSHYLAFVDCEGLDVNWSTMDRLLSKPGDLLFTFQTREIGRLVGRALVGGAGYEEPLNRFFGDDGWKVCRGNDDLIKLYADKLRTKHRDIIVSFPVKGPRGFRYDVIFATRRTRGGNPWLKGVNRIRERIERCDRKYVRRILNVLKGREYELGDFL